MSEDILGPLLSDRPTWYLLRTNPRAAAENMAIDEILLEQIRQIGAPLLRFYSWNEPAASFGYSQRYTEIAALTPLRPLVRRPTGGGLVPHDADWTYSLVFPPGAPWYSLKAIQSYQRVHGWIQAAFERLKISSQLSPSAQKESPGQCFVGAEQFDLLCQGRKIAGAAQRRNRHGLLIQGSIQPPTGASRPNWERAFCAVATDLWNVTWEEFPFTSAIETTGKKRADEKFDTREYTEHR